MRVALLQLNVCDDPAVNLVETERLVRQAVRGGAEWVLTPEVTNIVSANRARQAEMLRLEAEDPTLDRMRALAGELGIWLNIGSLALLSGEADGRFCNRQFQINPQGEIVARYDKIHMFDVELGGAESYRESAGYRPGAAGVLTETPWAKVGMTICYDMRFPALYRALAEAGAEVLTAPSAFTVPTGRAHWHVLLRSRAIETGCFVLAAAQWGRHAATQGRARETYGHSLIVDPWGEVLADGGEGTGVVFAYLDMEAVSKARARVPSLMNARSFSAPS